MQLPIGRDYISDPLRSGFARVLIDGRLIIDVSFDDLGRIMTDDGRQYVVETLAFSADLWGRFFVKPIEEAWAKRHTVTASDEKFLAAIHVRSF